jgi:hypothetical protein
MTSGELSPESGQEKEQQDPAEYLVSHLALRLFILHLTFYF